MLKIINKIFQFIIDIVFLIISILILISLYKIITVKYFDKPYMNIFGYSLFEIATGSMEPALNVKDIIIVKITQEVEENDIITYIEEGNLITHRVIEINDNYIITKGDANNSKDIKITKEDIVGKIKYTIPKGGIIREIIVTPKIIISITITLILISLCLSIKPKEKELGKIKKEKPKDEHNNDKMSFQELKNKTLTKGD